MTCIAIKGFDFILTLSENYSKCSRTSLKKHKMCGLPKQVVFGVTRLNYAGMEDIFLLGIR